MSDAARVSCKLYIVDHDDKIFDDKGGFKPASLPKHKGD